MAVIFAWVFWWKVVMKSEKAGVGGWLNLCRGWFGEDVGGKRLFFTKRITPKIFPGGGWQWGGGTLRYPWYIMYIMYICRDYIINLFEVSLSSNHIFPLRFLKEKRPFDWFEQKISLPCRSFLRFPSPRAPSACVPRGLWWLPHKWMKGRWWCLVSVALAIHPGRLTAWTWKWWFGWWFSFSIGWFFRFHVNLPGCRWLRTGSDGTVAIER